MKFAGTTVRLFFSKRGRKGNWNGLLTTDLSLSFLKAYRTYATRWTTEVAYHDCKQLLDFGKCQSVHFSAQIASFTLTNPRKFSSKSPSAYMLKRQSRILREMKFVGEFPMK